MRGLSVAKQPHRVFFRAGTGFDLAAGPNGVQGAAAAANGPILPTLPERDVTKRLWWLLGRVKVKAPRIQPCQCQVAWHPNSSPLSPLNHLLPDRATPEMIRLQAELGARHLDVVVCRIESTGRNRRFAFEPSSSMSPRALIRGQLLADDLGKT